MSAIRCSFSLKTVRFSIKNNTKNTFVICLQSEDCTTNLRIIFYTCGIVGKNFYFCGGNKCRHCESRRLVAIFIIAFNIK